MVQIYDELPLGSVDFSKLEGDAYKFVSRFGTGRLYPIVNSNDCWSCYEEFRKEDGAFEWPAWYPEMHYVVRGTAHIEYSLPPLHTTVQTADVKPGDVYLMPKGSYFHWEVTSDEPFGHVVTASPSPFTDGDVYQLRYEPPGVE